jgi:hypothetical protein
MNQRSYNLVTGLLFAVVGLVHAIRFAGSWPFIIGGLEIPKSASAIAVLATAYLALAAFRLNRPRPS